MKNKSFLLILLMLMAFSLVSLLGDAPKTHAVEANVDDLQSLFDSYYNAGVYVKDTVINVNDRICQFRIMEKQPAINFEEVEVLGNNDRGGIGSTGSN